MTDIKSNSLKLRALQGSGKTAEAEAFVHEMLTSKHEGLQSLALQVLGTWGHPEDKQRIIAALLDACRSERANSTAIRSVAALALKPLIVPDDTSWISYLCFSQDNMSDRHHLLPLFERLTPEATRSYIVAKLTSPKAIDRWTAARAIMHIRYPDEKELLEPLLTDPDWQVRGCAVTCMAGTHRLSSSDATDPRGKRRTTRQ